MAIATNYQKRGITGLTIGALMNAANLREKPHQF